MILLSEYVRTRAEPYIHLKGRKCIYRIYTFFCCHPGHRSGIQSTSFFFTSWIPASAGMTPLNDFCVNSIVKEQTRRLTGRVWGFCFFSVLYLALNLCPARIHVIMSATTIRKLRTSCEIALIVRAKLWFISFLFKLHYLLYHTKYEQFCGSCG